MKRFVFSLGVVLFLFALLPAAAMAEGRLSFGFKLGQFNPNDDVLNGFDTARNLEIFFGGRSKNVAFELGLLYRAPEGYGVFKGIEGVMRYKTIGIPLTIKGILPVGNNFDLFAGIGWDLYYTKMEVEETKPGYGTGSTDFNGYGAGLYFVGGADFKVTPSLALGAEMKWESSPHSFDDSHYDGPDELGGVTMGGVVTYLF